MSAREAVKPK
jgi:hypothetical protein